MAWLTTALRRSLLLVLIAAAGGALWSWRRDAADASPPGPAEWPPLPPPTTSTGPDTTTRPTTTTAPTEPAAEPVASAASVVNALVDAPEARSTDRAAGGWADPMEDGSCPAGYPIKANDNSGIFHLPGGRFYDRTKPERCYSDAAAALRDGYRQAKS